MTVNFKIVLTVCTVLQIRKVFDPLASVGFAQAHPNYAMCDATFCIYTSTMVSICRTGGQRTV